MNDLEKVSIDSVISDQLQLESLGLRVTDHIQAMLAYWDKDQICRFANKAYEDWFGIAREAMINKMSMKDLLGPLYQQNLPYIQGALAGKRQVFEREIPKPDGSGSRFSIANYYPDIQNGRVAGFFVHVADITSVKKLELELLEKERELLASLAVIKAQNKRLVNFTHLVSHNLRTHAGNLSELLKIFTESESEEEKAEMLALLQDLSAAFNENVAHLNEISEVKSKVNLRKELINPHFFIQKTLELLAINIQACRARILIDVDKTVELFYNPAYMESILQNIISNALKYRHPKRNLLIEIFLRKPDTKWYVLSVRDNGRGLDLDKHGDELFGMYKTFHGNSDAKGVGLFITKYQAEVMGGKIMVESKEGEGTIFHVYFPAGKYTNLNAC